MKHGLYTAAICLVLASCAAMEGQKPQTEPSQQQTAEPAVQMESAKQEAAADGGVVPGSINLLFLDTSGFDKDLSQGMRAKQQEVIVDVPAKFTLNDIPERMNKWLSKVEESGGKVQAQPVPEEGAATRGLLGLVIDVAVTLADLAHEKTTYGPAEDYNVMLQYDPKTGEVQSAVFYHR